MTQYYFIIPATSTQNERDNYSLKIDILTGVKNEQGEVINAHSQQYSEYYPHPNSQDGRFYYMINGVYQNAISGMTTEQQQEYLPSSEIVGCDDIKHDFQYLVDQDWFKFPDENEI